MRGEWKMKRYAFIIILCFLSTLVLAITPKHEYFQIQNNTKKEIEIRVEFQVIHSTRRFNQEIYDIPIIINDDLFSFNGVYILKPAGKTLIISYFPGY